MPLAQRRLRATVRLTQPPNTQMKAAGIGVERKAAHMDRKAKAVEAAMRVLVEAQQSLEDGRRDAKAGKRNAGVAA